MPVALAASRLDVAPPRLALAARRQHRAVACPAPITPAGTAATGAAPRATRPTAPAPVTLAVDLGRPPAAVLVAWLDREVAPRWLFATAGRPLACVRFEPQVGGSFHLVDRDPTGCVEYHGRYLRIDPARGITFTLALGPIASRVDVDVEPCGTGCRLRLTHAGVPQRQQRASAARWSGILHGLRVTLRELARG